MKVLNICTSDYANFAHDNANALRSVGVECDDYKTKRHHLNYQSQSKIIRLDQLKAIAKDFDIIQIFHSSIQCLDQVKHLGKKLVVYHTGSNYRKNHKNKNRSFNSYVYISFIALCEFSGLGAKNEKYIVGATKVSGPTLHNLTQPYTFAHYPSDVNVKGTSEIIQMLSKTKGGFKFNYSTELVNSFKQKKRMRECDVYIELFKPILNGRQYGSWGITALEAAAMGKIVVTQNLNNDVYIKEYGDCPLMLAKNQADFINKINYLLYLSPKEMLILQTKTYDWVNKNHSYIATGNRLKSILNELHG